MFCCCGAKPALDKGYTAPMWMTYKQATTLGVQVRKGEHGSLVVYADNPAPLR